MFTAGLELRTRAAEPSGPASLSLEGCWWGGAQPCLASPVRLGEGFLAGEAGGGAGYSCFSPWSCLSKKESCSPTPCLLNLPKNNTSD